MATRFGFGDNWRRFIQDLDNKQINSAISELQSQSGRRSLSGSTFLDAGCGSGLFSLAAAELGADRVVSFDYDQDAVTATRQLKERFYEGDPDSWKILQGDLLENDFMNSLGRFDFVYCWGVAHHTGDMWSAIENVSNCVTDNGIFCLGIYNRSEEGYQTTSRWKSIKYLYNHNPNIFQKLMVGGYISILVLYQLIWHRQLRTDWLLNRQGKRGMKAWTDMEDWLGGYPFEAATPEEIVSFVTESDDFRVDQIDAEYPRSTKYVNTYVFHYG